MNVKLPRATGHDHSAPNRAWVQIFRVGRHTASDGSTGDYTAADLDEIVATFRATSDQYKPVLRIGSHDGGASPAGGKVVDLRRTGDFLEALFETVPVVARAIAAGAYNGVSAGLRFGAKIGDKTFNRFLDHVAILGSRIPAVKGLNGPDGLSGLFDDNDGQAAVYNFEMEGDHMDERLAQENLELKDKLRKAEADLASSKSEFAESETKHADAIKALETKHGAELKAERDKVAQFEAAAAKSEVEAIVETAVRAGKVIPKVKADQVAVGLSLRTQANFSETGSAFSAWKKSLEDAPKVVDFDEKADAGGDSDAKRTKEEKEFSEGAELAKKYAGK